MQLATVALFGVVLFCLLWTEEVQAGSSFLSPADVQKNAGKKSQKKLMSRSASRREAEDLSEEPREIGVRIPLDVGLRMTPEEFQKQAAAVRDYLYTLLSLGSRPDLQDKTEEIESQ